MTMRPKVFYWRDAVTFGAAAALFSIATLIGWSRPDNDWRPLLAGTGVSLMAWGIYVVLLVKRWSFAHAIAYTTSHGISVIPTSFICPQSDFEDEVNSVIESWVKMVPEWSTKVQPALDGLVVTFKPFPFQIHGRAGVLAGLTYPRSKQSLVGYKMPLSSSALGHELGHIIYGTITRDWAEAAYHTFSKERKLP